MLSRRFSLLTLTFLYFCFCTFSFGAFPDRVFASADPITVTSQTSTVTFPKGIDFQISANDSLVPIRQATIFLMYNGTGIRELYPVAPATPAHAVTLHWHEDTSAGHFTPPGTQVSYYWKIDDSAGHTYATPIQSFQVSDNRFTWQHLSQGLLQVNWYNRPASLGQAILNEANADIQRISNKLGGGLRNPINLWIYASTDDFHGSLSPQTHEWVGGVAIPSLNQASIVVEDMNADTLMRDMPHELTHLVFHQLVVSDITPTWFDEGMAVYNQQFKEPMMSLRFKDALRSHTLLRLKDITVDFPSDANQAYLAYGESWNLVEYMYSTFKQSEMVALIKAMGNRRTSFDQDMTQALGVDTAHLENQWRIHLGQAPSLTADQLVPVTQSVPKAMPVISTTDSNAPLLLALGSLLILLSLLSVAGVLTYQWRARRLYLKREAQYILAMSLSSYHQKAYAPSPLDTDIKGTRHQEDERYPHYPVHSPYTPPAIREVKLPAPDQAAQPYRAYQDYEDWQTEE